MMEVYSYGKMNQQGVLTDYYTRRHTSQYRDYFLRVADALLRDADEKESEQMMLKSRLSSIKESGNAAMLDSVQKVISAAKDQVISNKKKAITLIKKSLKVMPVDLVIEYGEPQPGRDNYEVSQGVAYDSYSDGVLHDYVGVLYRSGDIEGAEKLGSEVAEHLESILAYFEHSEARFALNNKIDLVSALHNYMLIATLASDKEIGNPNGKLSKRTNAKINQLYQTVFPRIYNDLKMDDYGDQMKNLKGHLDAVGMRFGFIEKPAQQLNSPQGGGSGIQLTPEQIRMMMEQQQ